MMRLLLAEDDVSLSKAIVGLLKKNHYEADAVFDGEAALSYLQSDAYDGVILDVMMPKMDGIEVLRRVRAQGNPVPILILSARSEVADKVLGLDSGANDYLTKPFASAELLARIRAMTRAPLKRFGDLLTFGNLTLDRAAFELSSPFGSLRLTNKEYQMMEMLMTNPRCLISADRFMEKIWGYDRAAESASVWVYISYLRKKLIRLHANVEIRVTRGAGYSLETIP